MAERPPSHGRASNASGPGLVDAGPRGDAHPGFQEGFALLQRDFTFAFVTDRWLTMIGLAREETLGRRLFDVAPWMVGTPLEAMVRNAMQSRQPGEVEQLSAQERWLQVRAIPEGEGLALFVADIDALRRARAAAEASDTLRRKLTDSVPLAIVYLDADQRFVYANPHYVEHFGRGAVLGRTAAEVLGAGYAQVQPYMARALAGEQVTFETRIQRTGRDPLLVTATYVPDVDERGQVRGFAAVSEDITDKRRSQDITLQVLESITDAFFLLDGKWRFAYLNDTAVRLIGQGRTKAELLGNAIWDLYPEARGTMFEQCYSQTMFERVPTTFTEHYPPLHAWYEVNAYPAPEGISVYFRDVTDRVRAREVLRDQQRWLESVLNLLPMPLFFLEPGSARVRFVNEAGTRMAGGALPMDVPSTEYPQSYPATDLDGRPLDSEGYPGVRIARGQSRSEEVIWQTPEGPVTVVAQGAVMPAMHGHPATALMLLQDISALKHIEEELRAAVRTRDEFLSIASHELKTPLTSLKLQAETMIRSPKPERLGRFVEQVNRSVDRLSRLVDDMLDISRIASGKLELSRGPVDLAELTREVLERLRPIFATAGCAVELQGGDGLVGTWDRFRIEQALTNLFTNAAKYGRSKPVAITTRRAGSNAEVAVQDQGIGIAPADQQRIFERFERVSSTDGISGLGLGLYITRHIAQMHGGTVRLESVVKQGSCFTLCLPLVESGALK